VQGTNEIGFAVIATSIALSGVLAASPLLNGHRGPVGERVRQSPSRAPSSISGFRRADAHPDAVRQITPLQQNLRHGRFFAMFDRGIHGAVGAVWAKGNSALRRRRRSPLGRPARDAGRGRRLLCCVSDFPPDAAAERSLIPGRRSRFFLVLVRGPEGASAADTDGYVRCGRQIHPLRTPDVKAAISRSSRGIQRADVTGRSHRVTPGRISRAATPACVMLGGLLFLTPGSGGSPRSMVHYPYRPARSAFRQPNSVLRSESRFRKTHRPHGPNRRPRLASQGPRERPTRPVRE